MSALARAFTPMSPIELQQILSFSNMILRRELKRLTHPVLVIRRSLPLVGITILWLILLDTEFTGDRLERK